MTATKRRARRGWDPRTWAGLSPNGIGQQKPNHYGDMLRTIWENRRHPLYAWRILQRGVCDGCALGVAGFNDWTIDGVHLCTTRLRLLSINTADAFDHGVLADVAALRELDGVGLRALGRLAHPMRWRHGDQGFVRINWDEALDTIAAKVRESAGEQAAMYVTSRGLTNEAYYAAGKAARAMGIASVDSAARVCHAPSSVALKETIGAAATTCSFIDVIESDLIVLIGSNPANNQPVFMKYLYLAKRQGAKVVVVNPYLEPGLERYWVPSNAESALFGTKISDLHVPVRPGGDVAFCNAVLKRLIERGDVDQAFIASHTEAWDELVAALDDQPADELLAAAGLTAAQVEAFVDLYASSPSAILVWSMGITQHRTSVDTVQAIVNLALARGNVGRDGAGLMPIRGHSGVQGGAEMGAYSTAFPGMLPVTPENAAVIGEAWGFEVPARPGFTALEMVDAAGRGELDVLYIDGGNFLDVLPDSRRVAESLGRVPLRVHQDIVLSTQMLVPPAPGGEVILLPTRTRYEQEGGGTETTTERRIAFSPEVPGHQIGEARSEWRIFAELATRTRPDLASAFAWSDNRALREEIARVVPLYDGIQHLASTGDSVQWGGRHLAGGGEFPTATGRGRFTAVAPPTVDLPPGSFLLSTRRGKQFNSIVHGATDPLTGAGRDAVYMSDADASEVGVRDGARVRLRSDVGTYEAVVKVARLPRRTLQVHWPEGNVLIPGGAGNAEPRSKVPDYNAVVTVETF